MTRSDMLRTPKSQRGGSETELLSAAGGSETELLSIVRAVAAGHLHDCRISEEVWRVQVSGGSELLLTHLVSGAEKRLRRDADLEGIEFLWESQR